MQLLFKIEEAGAWEAARVAGTYYGSPVDRQDGFIHLSAADQVRGTLARHFAGRSNLLLIAVDAEALGDALRWEPSRGGARFPHLYAPLPMSAVAGARPIPADGELPDAPDWGM